MDDWRSQRSSFDPTKTLILAEKMLRLLEIFLRKNSSPFFSKLVRVRYSNVYILLVVTIKPCNFCSWHFLLRPLLSEIFAGLFHRAKTTAQGWTVLKLSLSWWRSLSSLQSKIIPWQTKVEKPIIKALVCVFIILFLTLDVRSKSVQSWLRNLLLWDLPYFDITWRLSVFPFEILKISDGICWWSCYR